MSHTLLEKLTFGLGRNGAGMKAWQAPSSLDRGQIGQVCLAMDRNGRGQALWENAGHLWTQNLGPGHEASYGRIPLGPGRNPRISANLEGRGLAAWIHEGSTDQSIVGLPFDPSQARASSRTLFDTFGAIHDLQVAVDRRGCAMVVWSHECEDGWETLGKHFDLRSYTWEELPTRLGEKVQHPVDPRLAMNRRGQAVVVWQEQNERVDRLVAAFHLPSEKLWSDHAVTIAEGRTRDHQVAMDHSGNAMVLWVKEDYGQRPALQARLWSSERGDWDGIETLVTAQGLRRLHLGMTGTGEGLAMWLQSEGSALAFLHSKAYRKGGWEDRVTRLDGEGGRVDDFAMALGPKGAASLLCLLQRQEGHVPVVRDRNPSWNAPQTLARRNDAGLSQPHLAICPEGAVALWTAGNGAEARLVWTQRGT